MKVTVHAYPWDVLWDEDFAARMESIQPDEVVVAASYHAVRAATPWDPCRALVTADHAALYRPVREQVWGSSGLVPRPAGWMPERDPFGAACATLGRVGLSATAWVVLTHSSHLGAVAPSACVRNCFGEVYTHALCPSNGLVQAYARTLVQECLRNVDLTAVCLEACGQLGIDHGGHHDKTATAFSARTRQLLSICCCDACQLRWREQDLDVEPTLQTLRRAVRADTASEHADEGCEVLMDRLINVREIATRNFREVVLGAVSDTAPHASTSLHAHPDLRVTGGAPGTDLRRLRDVEAVVVPAWQRDDDTRHAITAAASAVPRGVHVGAYVSVLDRGTEAADVEAHVTDLATRGADELHLYHAGLANKAQTRLMAVAANAARAHATRSPT